MRSDVSGRRLYGFCSRLCHRQVLVLLSWQSWLMVELAVELAKDHAGSGGVLGGGAPPAKANFPKFKKSFALL